MKQLFLIAFVLFLFSACTGTEPGAEPVPTQAVLAEEPVVTEIAQLIETPTPEPTIVPSNTPEPTVTVAIPTEIPTSLPNASPEWITHIIDLYPLQLNLPDDWTITEVNRQEEPTDWGLVLGHDCADYIIANSDSMLQIHLLPACGLGEGANFLCPSDTAIIGPSIYPDLHIVRFQFPNSQAFGYTEAGDELMYCADSPRISYRDGDVNSYMLVELDYAGNEAELPQLIEITDEIIRSITAQPTKAAGPILSLEPALALCADVTEIPQIECEALIALYTQLDGWSLTASEHGWMQTNAPCSWSSVECIDLHVVSLDLTDNGLSNLPPEIGNLTSLTTLDLRNNQLSRLPPEIGNLTNLEHLYLSDNQLSILPPEIGNLTNLAVLTVMRNQLIDLPPEIGNLVNLTILGLDDNQLTNLLPEIGNFVNLTDLGLMKNQLTNLPPEIGNLVNLTFLGLGNNQLTSLPPEIGNLDNLGELLLYKNQLTSLPPEMGYLSNLRSLVLTENNLTNLPPELCASFQRVIMLEPESLCTQ